MNAPRLILRSVSTSGAKKTTSAVANVDPGYFRLKKVQESFQKSDGKPVFLKGSFMDQVLYRTTVALSLIGLGSCFKLYYDLSMPKN